MPEAPDSSPRPPRRARRYVPVSARERSSLQRRVWYLSRRVVEAARENQWLLPVVAIVAGVVLSLLLGTVGQSPDPGNWTVSVDRARDAFMALLSLIVAGLSIMLAVASLTIQNVVGRFSLRMLRLYQRDLRDKALIATFALTASFVISEMIRIRGLPPDSPAPIPGVTVSVALIATSGVMMIWYVTVLSAWFRVDQTARRVARGAISGADALAQRYADLAVAEPELFDRPAGAVSIDAPRSGYFSDLDIDRVSKRARQHDLTVVIDCVDGAGVHRGEPIGWMIAADGRSAPNFEGDPVAEAIEITGTMSLEGAVDYRIVVLADIAIMALSPAVNDPNTAVQVIDEMAFLLPALARFEPGPRAQVDDDGVARVVVRSPTFVDYVDLATEQIVLYGLTDPAVVRALDRLIGVLDRLDPNDHNTEAVERLRARVHPPGATGTPPASA